MKAAILIILSLIMTNGCGDEQIKVLESTKIQYTATSRGFFRRVIIEKDKVDIYKDRKTKEVTETRMLTEDEKTSIAKAFSDIKLEEIQNMKSPTERRFYDGAAIADLKITHDGKVYASRAFDHMTPPDGIAKLVNLVAEYTKDE